MSEDIGIQTFLQDEGFEGEAGLTARAVLESTGFTRPGKKRIALSKLPEARSTLHQALVRVCGAQTCIPINDGRAVVRVASSACEICGGSRNGQAGRLAMQAMLDNNLRHLLVLGGSRETRAELGRLLHGIEVRSIDGTAGTRASPTVEADLNWADLLMIWAGTPLPHKVSKPYTDGARRLRLTMITVPRHGVEALCLEILRHLQA